MSTFPPIEDYALLSDCAAMALVAPDGGVEWLCLPRPDSPSVFGALLDRSAGRFRFGPARVTTPSGRRYLPGTMVVETTWCLPAGTLVVRDAMVIDRWRGRERAEEYRRPPGDFAAAGMLVRTAECIEGEVELVCDCLPLFDYGRRVGAWSYAGETYGEARCAAGDGAVSLTLTGSLRLEAGAARALARERLRAGESAFVALSWGGRAVDDTAEALRLIDGTAGLWRAWLRGGTIPDRPRRPLLERSVLTLKALTYAPTGAILAAATTSLPETPGGQRNWDYRYSWVRDSAFLLRSLLDLGFVWEALQYFTFLMETASSGPLQTMYGIDGTRRLTEHTLEHLSGYGGARPVRIGNGAWEQTQNDMWGMLLDAVAVHIPDAVEIGPPGWRVIEGLVDNAIAVWREPDRGIWEVRGAPRHFTASKALCWVALDRGARLAASRGDEALRVRWRALADEIHADVCAHGVDGRGVFVQYYGASTLDASALLLLLTGFLPPDDPRMRATVLAIADGLTEDGLVLRYRTEETDDGLAGAEGGFVICSFWLVTALARIGETERAERLCSRLLASAGPLGLYAEEIDPLTGRHLGNYPQAFTHLALIEAVLTLDAARERG
ncbi:glycoside hydrolase family 15 protein [Tomitella gaofuii]|uniref:glycoside hydrolase family 15 protein n=1 Tax=Tomitella gaofuii TaxID=2760083 RepID=UPI0015F80819|nr:glycoside hydrolase family 15 protein [Tomitella gaofuii]